MHFLLQTILSSNRIMELCGKLSPAVAPFSALKNLVSAGRMKMKIWLREKISAGVAENFR
jgi:hypothetical protein